MHQSSEADANLPRLLSSSVAGVTWMASLLPCFGRYFWGVQGHRGGFSLPTPTPQLCGSMVGLIRIYKYLSSCYQRLISSAKTRRLVLSLRTVKCALVTAELFWKGGHVVREERAGVLLHLLEGRLHRARKDTETVTRLLQGWAYLSDLWRFYSESDRWSILTEHL